MKYCISEKRREWSNASVLLITDLSCVEYFQINQNDTDDIDNQQNYNSKHVCYLNVISIERIIFTHNNAIYRPTKI